MGQRVDEATVAAEVGVALFGRHAGRIPQAEPSPAPGRGPRRRDLAKPREGSPSTCGARAMHILALQPNLMSRSAGYATGPLGPSVAPTRQRALVACAYAPATTAAVRGSPGPPALLHQTVDD